MKIVRASYGLGMGQLCERYMLCVGLVLAACQLASGSVLDENFPITTAIPTTVLNGTFPVTFSWGTSTASYQVEGGWLDGGKGLSTWDSFSHTPGMIANGDTGDVANDMYHLYPADIELMKAQGLQHYRFSISWARIMPSGVGPVNQAGIDYYNDLINLLIKNGIEPHVTIYHNDMPLALTFYPYMSNPMLDGERFPIWFTDYAQVLFENFGDRVSNWFTFNEPWCFSVLGIDGDRDPYTIAHTSIIAHARVVDLYRSQYLQRSPADKKGTIGIVLNTAHFYPLTADSQLDQAAADRAYDFQYDWFLGPMVRGEYPQSMRETLGDRLPSFTEEEVRLVKGSLDFVAINYYFPYMTTAGGWSADDAGSYSKDVNVTNTFDPSWPLSQTGWGMYGGGLRDLLIHTSEKYNLPIYITENGLAWDEPTVADSINDVTRQNYYYDHIEGVGEALLAGADVRGFFCWSFQDNLEWLSGYEMTFGLIRIERPSLKRIIKNSLRWYSGVLEAWASAVEMKK